MAGDKQFGSSDPLSSQRQHEQGQANDPHVEQTAGSLQEAGTHAKAIVREARQMAEQQTEALMGWIKERPLTSVLIGAAVGYILGRIARR
jgi:ElaB/YqjD/DUF883 family membrane-anchored ribosome-binding protein